MLHTLAIETSCDDTSIAIVRYDPVTKKSSSLHRADHHQNATHNAYGGVVPELASREHHETILRVLQQLDIDWDAIDCISVTTRPGLPGSLIIGKTVGHMLATIYKKPFLPVNHLDGHSCSLLLDRTIDDIKRPVAVLSLSGGHNTLRVMDYRDGQFEREDIATTRDDAVGEAFDKVARLLGGPYPGGYRIQQTALNGKPTSKRRCPRTYLGPHDFSFSGIKGHLSNLHHRSGETRTDTDKADIAYEFQEAVCDMIAYPLALLCESRDIATIGIVGGVSANTRLRSYIHDRFADYPVIRPTTLHYCTDNASMIGCTGLLQHLNMIPT